MKTKFISTALFVILVIVLGGCQQNNSNHNNINNSNIDTSNWSTYSEYFNQDDFEFQYPDSWSASYSRYERETFQRSGKKVMPIYIGPNNSSEYRMGSVVIRELDVSLADYLQSEDISFDSLDGNILDVKNNDNIVMGYRAYRNFGNKIVKFAIMSKREEFLETSFGYNLKEIADSFTFEVVDDENIDKKLVIQDIYTTFSSFKDDIGVIQQCTLDGREVYLLKRNIYHAIYNGDIVFNRSGKRIECYYCGLEDCDEVFYASEENIYGLDPVDKYNID